MVIDVAMVLGMIVITSNTYNVLFIVRFTPTMSEKITAEKLLNTFVETLGEKQKFASFFEEEKSTSINFQFNRLFGRQKPVYNILGGGKCMTIPIKLL